MGLTHQKVYSFTDLIIWQKGHQLVLETYEITKQFPREEQFGLTDQIRRAIVSFTSNIAEGFSRKSYKEKMQFYAMALGSLTEVQNQLMIARDLHYISKEQYGKLFPLTIELHKMANAMIKSSKELPRSYT